MSENAVAELQHAVATIDSQEYGLSARVIIAVSRGTYVERAQFRIDGRALNPEQTRTLLNVVTSSGGWVVEHVRWLWKGDHIGVEGCTLIRSATDG